MAMHHSAFQSTALASKATSDNQHDIFRRYVSADISKHFVGQKMFGGTIVAVDRQTGTVVVADGTERLDAPFLTALRVPNTRDFMVGELSQANAHAGWCWVSPVAIDHPSSTIYFDSSPSHSAIGDAPPTHRSGFSTARTGSDPLNQPVSVYEPEAQDDRSARREQEYFEQQMGDLQSTMHDGDDAVAALKAQHTSDIAKIHELESVIETRDQSGNKIEGFFQAISDGLKNAQHHNDRGSDDQVNKLLQQSKERCADLETELSRQYKLANKATTLRSQLQKQKDENKKLNSQADQIDQLQTELSMQRQLAHNASEAQAKERVEQVAALQDALDQKEQEQENLESQFERLLSLNSDLQSQIQSQKGEDERLFEAEKKLKGEKLMRKRSKMNSQMEKQETQEMVAELEQELLRQKEMVDHASELKWEVQKQKRLASTLEAELMKQSQLADRANDLQLEAERQRQLAHELQRQLLQQTHMAQDASHLGSELAKQKHLAQDLEIELASYRHMSGKQSDMSDKAGELAASLVAQSQRVSDLETELDRQKELGSKAGQLEQQLLKQQQQMQKLEFELQQSRKHAGQAGDIGTQLSAQKRTISELTEKLHQKSGSQRVAELEALIMQHRYEAGEEEKNWRYRESTLEKEARELKDKLKQQGAPAIKNDELERALDEQKRAAAELQAELGAQKALAQRAGDMEVELATQKRMVAEQQQSLSRQNQMLVELEQELTKQMKVSGRAHALEAGLRDYKQLVSELEQELKKQKKLAQSLGGVGSELTQIKLLTNELENGLRREDRKVWAAKAEDLGTCVMDLKAEVAAVETVLVKQVALCAKASQLGSLLNRQAEWHAEQNVGMDHLNKLRGKASQVGSEVAIQKQNMSVIENKLIKQELMASEMESEMTEQTERIERRSMPTLGTVVKMHQFAKVMKLRIGKK